MKRTTLKQFFDRKSSFTDKISFSLSWEGLPSLSLFLSLLWLIKGKLPTIHVRLTFYSYEFSPVKRNASGTLKYIRNHLPYKARKDSNIYTFLEKVSTFIKICSPKKLYIIIGYIYKHSNMNINEFNGDYLNEFLDKLSKENKTIFPLHDFKINWLNYHTHPPTNIKNHLSYKARKDSNIYKFLEKVPTFIKICNPKKLYIINGYIYKHPNMNVNKFNGDYLNELLDKLSKENKIICP